MGAPKEWFYISSDLQVGRTVASDTQQVLDSYFPFEDYELGPVLAQLKWRPMHVSQRLRMRQPRRRTCRLCVARLHRM